MQELQDIVAQCLQKDPSQRLTCSQLLKHKFFKVSVLHMLGSDPSKRAQAAIGSIIFYVCDTAIVHGKADSVVISIRYG